MRLKKEEAADVLEAVRAGLEVWRSRDGMSLTDKQIDERSRNIAFSLYGIIDEFLEERENG